MNEANIGEVPKRNILSSACYKCEACGAVLGFGKEDKKPHFHYLVHPMQGGDQSHSNITVLCPEDSARFHELDRDELKRKVENRENEYDLS
ncbi:MAG: hypothetical protein D6733_00065 [Methanobacteriota archaeon]|nr:MAG: hypothetical protein D6733_00065 [Euryarchaeota archaeon]